ncbi:MAG: sigma-70 family RNA polymerase sigma factor, partial [Myxococcota bacterium]
MNDRELITRALDGSVPAFTELVGRYRDGVFRYLLSRCTNRADAEDALQDTLLNAFRYLYSYDPRWRFSTWLYRIALRNAGRKRRRELPQSDQSAEWVDDSADPLSHAISQSTKKNVWTIARRSLKEEVYAALWLRYVEDMS